MDGRFRVPMFVVAAALLGLIVLLATLQYRWLGQVSAAERERMKASLATSSTGFARDFDQEVTRAYLTFQVDLVREGENLAARMASLHDSWRATSRHPRLIRDVYLLPRASESGPTQLQRFNSTARVIEPVEWPASLEPVRKQLAVPDASMPSSTIGPGTTMMIRTMPNVVWESVPALLVPMPMVLVNHLVSGAPLPQLRQDRRTSPTMAYIILELDKQYISAEMLPALARHHFNATAEGVDYVMAVVNTTAKESVYSTAPSFTPDGSAEMDASADMFQVRLQEFGPMASEVRRFTSFATRIDTVRAEGTAARTGEARRTLKPPASGTLVMRDSAPVSIMLQQHLPGADRKALEAGIAAAARGTVSPKWRLVVKHPSGSLETAVSSLRRRNLLVSSGILGILGVSIGFLVVSTRRAQDLARQQMEFVAAVSHELRTPLAVIRSAADNLADGVVYDHPQVRKYGNLVRGEGRRLTEMVEQILELAGIQSGQRGFALAPIHVPPLVRHVVHASSTLIEQAGMEVHYDLPDTLPPVLGEEQGLKRVFQNLVGNAIKYGASGRWIGISARASGREVLVTVADKGMGIGTAEQANIFDAFYRTPDVIAAQIQGAGLGLSLVQRIVEAHGGRISVRSAPGTGSEFTVHLPSATEQPAPRSSTATDAARTSA